MANNLIDKTQEQLEKYALKYYKISLKKQCNIDDPKLLSEKIQWYTFRYKNPLFPYIVDKVTFKKYIKDILGDGYTIPLIASWKTVEEFETAWNSDILPKEFCLKSNLQSDGKCIKIIHNKDLVNFKDLKKEVAEWFKPENTNINSLARNFYDSVPQVFAEKFMSNYKDQLYDYKFYCFDGYAHCICSSKEHFEDEHYPITYFNLKWEMLDVQSGNHRVEFIPKPKHFEQMVELAQKLSKGFPFVRVDFFDTDEQLYVAELTFNPGGGFFNFKPESFDREMGDLFKLPM